LEYFRTPLFKRSFKGLIKDQQEYVISALTALAKHPFHPFDLSLKVHKLSGKYIKARTGKRIAIMEMHADGDLLVTFHFEDDNIVLRNCGSHKNVLRDA